MGESKKSFFRPSFPRKYKGNPNNIICRSTWETKFCNYCDLNENILEWGSEEFFIKYVSPVDNRFHRYYPDFLIKVKESTGEIKTYECKPYAVNTAKWAQQESFVMIEKSNLRLLLNKN